MSNATRTSKHTLARHRAYKQLAERHPDEFADLFHQRKHVDGIAHRHDENNPETISWWGAEQEASA